MPSGAHLSLIRLRLALRMSRRTFVVVACAAAVAALAWRFGPRPADVLAALGNLEPRLVALAVVVNAAAVAVRAEAWRRLLRHAGGAVPPRAIDTTSAYAVGLLTNLILPARVGEVARVAVLRRRLDAGGPPWQAVAGSVIGHRLLDVVPFSLLVASVLVTGGPAATGGPVVLGVVVGVLAAVGIAAALARRRAGRLLVGLRAGLAGLGDMRVAAGAVALETVAWIGQLAVVWISLVALGAGAASLASAALVLVAINLAVALPALPGGVGLFQAATAAALAAQGLSAASGVAFGVGLQGIEILTTLAIGLPFALREGLDGGRSPLARLRIAG